MASSVGDAERVNGVQSPQSLASELAQLTISPYATRTVAIRIGSSGTNFSLPEAIINRYDGLRARLDPKNSFGLINLSNVDEAVGHTLIHYLYTGEYETLGLDSHDIEATALAEFKVGILAYCAALSCKLDTLRELAKAEIVKAAPGVSLSDLQRTIREVGAKLPLDDEWFSMQLQVWIRARLEANETLFTKGRLLTIVGQDAVFDRAVTKAVVDMYAKLLTSFQEHETANKPVVDKAQEKAAEVTEDAGAPTRETAGGPFDGAARTGGGLASPRSPPVDINPISTLPEDHPPAETAAEPAATDEPAESETTAVETNLANGTTIHGENLQKTDDEGDILKAKSSKKANKKAKKRKDSMTVGSV